MSALSYLISRKFKNRLLEIIKKPSQLIIILIFIAMIGFTVFAGKNSSGYELRDINEFYSGVMLLYTFAFYLVSKNGFSNGAAMFSMADVNLIFVSPFKNTKVLFYGLLSQLGRSLTLGLFILYQSSLLNSTYGVTFVDLVYVLLGYGITVFLSQMLSMLIYSLTSSSDRSCKIAKGIYYTVIIIFFAFLFYGAYSMGGINLKNLVAASKSGIIKAFPVSGVVSMLVEGIMESKINYILLSVAYCLAFPVIFYIVVYFFSRDFYEDVLKSAEVSFSAITARKEGKAPEAAPKNVKVGKTGFSKGEGASVLFEKHKIENRRSKVFLLGPSSIMFVVLSAIYSFIFKDSVMIFALNAYMLTIGVATGRWAKEFTLPYVYMIPEKNYKKLYYILKEQIPSLCVESIICFIPVWYILKLTIPETMGMIIGRISFGFLFIGVNLVLQRLFGTSDKKALVVFVMFILCMLFSIPSIVAAVLVAGFLPFNVEFAYIAMATVNTIISAITLLCSRNILEYADFNNT